EAGVPVALLRPEVPPEDGLGHRPVEREDLRPPSHPDVVAQPCRRFPVHDAEGTPRVALQGSRERGAADDPNCLAVTVQPDGGLARAVLRTVGEVRVQRPGQEFVQVKSWPAPGGDAPLNYLHMALPSTLTIHHDSHMD